MKLYYSKGSCSLVIRIILQELGLRCEFEAVNLRSKKTEHGVDYWTINPKGSVPALLIDKQELLTENVAIQQYLADTFHAAKLLPPVGNFKRYRVIEWLNYISTELHKSCSPLFSPLLPDDVKTQLLKPIVLNKLSFINEALADKHVLFGSDFTLADAYLFVILTWLPALGIERADYPYLTRYFNALSKRPSIIQALKDEGF